MSKPVKSTGKRSAKTPARTEKLPEKRGMRDEIISIIVIAAALILLICLFSAESAGAVGKFVRDLLVSFFGIGAYVIPFAVVATCLVVIFADGRKILRSHIVMLCCLFAVIISTVHLFTMVTGEKFINLADYIRYYYSEGSAKNGGLFGAIIGNTLFAALGKTGSFVVLFTSGTILLILITGRSLFSYLRKIKEQANVVIEKNKRRIVSKGAAKHGAKPIRVESLRNKTLEVYDLPQSNGKKEFFNHLIDNDKGEKPAGGERLDVINEHIRGGITRPKSAHDSINEMGTVVEFIPAAKKPSLESLNEIEPKPVVLPELLEEKEDSVKEFDKPKEKTAPPEFSITVKGIGIEGAEIPAESELAMLLGSDDDDDDYEPPAYDAAEYEYPAITLLDENNYTPSISTMVEIRENSAKLEETLKSFGVEAKVIEVSKGPTVTRYELSPGPGVKVNKISSLQDDLALSLAAMGIRIEAPIPGKSAVGIELPNKETQPVFLRELIEDPAFKASSSKLTFAVGKDITGNTIISDIAKMPHVLIAGSTGSGKSVCINALITSLLYKARPDEVKLLMIDPKVVELSVYNGIPHLLIPVVTDPKKASGALNWAVLEMERRYGLLASVNVRDLKGYNAAMAERGEPAEKLPQIVIIIDELADLMLSVGKEVEESICRIAQKARAAGIHLVIATQRPSVNVITGTIKANIGSRLAFAVSSGIDSRTILDQIGAERLLGKGDMLFAPMGLPKPQRVQCAFVSDKEVERIVEFLKGDGSHTYDYNMISEITSATTKEKPEGESEASSQLVAAAELIFEKDKASTSMLQRYFRIGYNSAARLMEELESHGIVGPEDGSKPRKISMTRYEWQEYRKRL